MPNQLLLIHIADHKNPNYQNQEYVDMLFRKDCEILNSVLHNKNMRKKIIKDLSIIIVNQKHVH